MNDIRPHPHLEFWYRHGDLSDPLFFKGWKTASKEVKTIIIWGMWSFSYVDGEIVSLVHATRREHDVTSM